MVPLPVAVDSVRQVILNLLINACAATPAGGTVHLRARATESALMIEVGDQGPGLPDDLAKYLVGHADEAPGAWAAALDFGLCAASSRTKTGKYDSFRRAAYRRSSGLRGRSVKISHDWNAQRTSVRVEAIHAE